MGTVETQTLHGPQQRVPAQHLQQHRGLGADWEAIPDICKPIVCLKNHPLNRVSAAKGEGRRQGAKLFQVRSVALNIAGVSSRPLVEATENQFPNWSNHRNEEGVDFDWSQYY